MSDSDASRLDALVRAVADDPSFLAGWLSATPGEPKRLAARLSLDEGSVMDLLLSRSPRPTSFADDVLAVARHIDRDPTALAAGLREAAALGGLAVTTQPHTSRKLPTSPATSLLAAARDAVEDLVQSADRQEGYLRRLAETVLSAPPSALRGLAIEGVIAWSAPLAVVSLPHLNPSAATEWLTHRGAPVPATFASRPLRGFLLAWRGSGLAFVDGGLAIEDRRLTLGHELGHFLIDYLQPRRRVVQRDPDLLAVMDGHRVATESDRARAAIAGVSLGLHTRLIDRDSLGEAGRDTETAEDRASRFALELLAPWEDLLDLLRTNVEAKPHFSDSLDAATELVEERFIIPRQAARSRARAGLEGIGITRGFFDRW